MIEFILNASILLLAIFLFTYFLYCIGLVFVLRRLGGRGWMAFFPLLNYKELIKSLGLPLRWFGYSLIPYAGTIYSLAIAERLGKVFGRGYVFSSFWLTIGSPIGMNIIGHSKTKMDLDIIKDPPPNLKTLKARLSRQKKKI